MGKTARIQIRIGVIDLGTNSIRFDIYEVAGVEAIRICREKEMIRLGDSVFPSGRIDRAAQQRLLRVLKHYGQIAQHFNVGRMVAVATSALREASNAASFIRRAQATTGIDIRVISGLQEARLIAEGTLTAYPRITRSFATVDIGGGSTEISVGRNGKVRRSTSLPLGVARLTQQYFSEKTADPDERYAAARRLVRENLQTRLRAQHDRHAQVLIGSSGTVRAFAVLEKAAGGGDRRVTRRFLGDVMKQMVHMSSKEIRRMPGMDPKRVDLMLAGGAILEEVMDLFGSRDVKVSECSLREGLVRRELSRLKAKQVKKIQM